MELANRPGEVQVLREWVEVGWKCTEWRHHSDLRYYIGCIWVYIHIICILPHKYTETLSVLLSKLKLTMRGIRDYRRGDLQTKQGTDMWPPNVCWCIYVCMKLNLMVLTSALITRVQLTASLLWTSPWQPLAEPSVC